MNTPPGEVSHDRMQHWPRSRDHAHRTSILKRQWDWHIREATKIKVLPQHEQEGWAGHENLLPNLWLKGRRMLSPRTRQSFLSEMTLVYMQLGETLTLKRAVFFSQFHFHPLMINCGVLKRAVFHIACSPFLLAHMGFCSPPSPPADMSNFQPAYITYRFLLHRMQHKGLAHKCSMNSTCKSNEKGLHENRSRKSPLLSFFLKFLKWNYTSDASYMLLVVLGTVDVHVYHHTFI
jgi:hypothetical protein